MNTSQSASSVTGTDKKQIQIVWGSLYILVY